MYDFGINDSVISDIRGMVIGMVEKIKKIGSSIGENRFGGMIINLLGVAIGSFIYACGISLFLDPNNLAPGGASGLAIVLNRICNIETGTLYFIINVPIMVLGLWKYGIRFIASTFFSILLNSYFTNKLAHLGALTDDLLIATMAGSVLVGVGVAIVFKSRATTGGTDIIVKVLHDKYKHIKTGVIFLLTDIVIVAFSGFVFKDINIIIYALISVFVQGKVLDLVLYVQHQIKHLALNKHRNKRVYNDVDVLEHEPGERNYHNICEQEDNSCLDMLIFIVQNLHYNVRSSCCRPALKYNSNTHTHKNASCHSRNQKVIRERAKMRKLICEI